MQSTNPGVKTFFGCGYTALWAPIAVGLPPETVEGMPVLNGRLRYQLRFLGAAHIRLASCWTSGNESVGGSPCLATTHEVLMVRNQCRATQGMTNLKPQICRVGSFHGPKAQPPPAGALLIVIAIRYCN
jgi:hypothetical protein